MKKLAHLQILHPKAIVILAVVLTIFLGIGLQNIRMETDFTNELPQDLPVIKLDNRITDTFGGQDVILIVVQLDESDSPKRVQDIRDPRVMDMLLDLQEKIEENEKITNVQSIAAAFEGRETYLSNLDTAKAFLSQIPEAERAFNRDYSATMLYAFANLGQDEDAIKTLEKDIQENIADAYKPPGVKLSLTGSPSIRTKLMDILQSDAVFTVSLAAAIILALLVAISKPRIKGVLIFTPLVLGLLWTMGFMGWADIPLSMATVGVGAMILGLGVEYGVFYSSRYFEEREKGLGQDESLRLALTSVGSSIVGSSLTTIVGFLALLFASMPMLHHLGIALAFGIFCCVSSALVVNPPLILLQEQWSHNQNKKKHKKLEKRINAADLK